MKPILALVLLAALASPAAAGTLKGGSGTLKPSAGTFGGAREPAYRAKPSEAGGSTPRRYGVPAPTASTPSTSSTPPLGAGKFEPYKGSSVYSNRGGVDAYPRPGKPKGYIDPKARPGF